MRSAAAWPPPPPEDETEEEQRVRLVAEEEAKKVSDSIDRSIELDKERRKRLRCIKILLLGQAESGKSTILKNFQLHFAPKAFEAGAEVWRPVIHLNLVRSVNFILNILSNGGPNLPDSSTPPKALSGELRRLSLSLAPLREVEASLVQSISGAIGSSSDGLQDRTRKSMDVATTSTGWKGFLRSRLHFDHSNDQSSAQHWDKLDDSNRRILSACAPDMVLLWREPDVHRALKEHCVSLRDQSGFFLDDVQRITRENYVPCSSDILRARVQTLGPQEHQIQLEIPSRDAKSWIIYDVGGRRTQRAAWAQFFDDVNVIIFLAPLSAFDQMLEEDSTVNRLNDSMKLWQQISRNRILQNVELILFLNKLDILDAKLKSGIQFSNYFLAYSEANETKPIAKHLVDTFFVLHQKCAPKRRSIYPHLTCAIDIKATAKIIDRVYHLVIIKFLSTNHLL